MKVYMAVMVDEHDWQYLGGRVFKTLNGAQRWLYDQLVAKMSIFDEPTLAFEDVNWLMKYPQYDVDHKDPVRYSLFRRSYNLIVYEEDVL